MKDNVENDTYYGVFRSYSLASNVRNRSVWKPVRNYTVYLMTCEPATVSAQQFVFSVEPDNQQCHHLHIII